MLPEPANADESQAVDQPASSDVMPHNEADKDVGDGVSIPDTNAVEPEYVTGFRLVLVMSCVMLSTLLGALDIGIVATAIPAITDDFGALNYVGWYGSAIFLLVATSGPLWGKLFKYFDGKLVYLASIIVYLIGSIVAASAPNSVALIVGRAIQGWGCAGTLSGSVLMINYVAEPKKQPMLIGMWMGVFMFATILGPLIGGAFTSSVTWRWCFWVNLPVGGVILAALVLFLRIPRHIKPYPASWTEILLQLDLPGFILILASLVSLTLASQWGGQTKPWNDGSVIATLVVWIVLTIAFLAVEYFEGEYAMVPLRLFKPRITWTSFLYGHVVNIANFQVLFYLPIYFQSVHGQSAITSGVNSLPFMALFAFGAILSGGLVGKTGLFQPFELVGGLLATAGAALLYTLEIGSSKARYIGPQVLFGFGIGLSNQVPMMVAQGSSKPEDVASTSAVMLMCNAMAGAYFVTAAQSLFANRLLQVLATDAPNIDTAMVLATGASDVRRVFSGAELAAVLDAYMVGVKDVFVFSLAGAALTVLISLMVPFKKLPGHEKAKDATQEKNEAL